jgi:hypothetical protein
MAWTTLRTWTTGELVTAAMMNQQIRDNMGYLGELYYAERTTALTLSSTSSTSPDDVMAGAALTYAATPIVIEFYAPAYQTPSTAAGHNCNITLWDGATDLGLIAKVVGPGNSVGTTQTPIYVVRKLTPTAGSHTYKIRAYFANTAGTFNFGAGGVGNFLPGFLRITGVVS